MNSKEPRNFCGMTDEQRVAFENTTFWVEGPQGYFAIRIGEHCAELDALLRDHRATSWAYVTAFNPGACKQLLPRENHARQDMLENELQQRGFVLFPGSGVGRDGNWPPERSVLVLGISEEQASQFGRQFGQIAIVAGNIGSAARLVRLCRQPQDH